MSHRVRHTQVTYAKPNQCATQHPMSYATPGTYAISDELRHNHELSHIAVIA
jgi:hypothetical protein